MSVVLALKTITRIDEMVYEDQGASFRQHLKTLMPEAGDAYEGRKDDFRSHLGASMIGRECARELYYNFRWAKAPLFDGRMLRLFNRGHLEEPRLVALMLMLGCEIWSHDENGNQFRISSCGGHFGSAIDAVVGGCLEIPDKPILGEFKTYNDKQFKKLAGNNWKEFMEYVVNPIGPRITFEGAGVKIAKWDHYVQMQIYMGYFKLSHAIYMAVNKNDDHIYAEIIEFDQATCDLYMARGDNICLMNSGIPARISDNIGFWKCRFCTFKGICHSGDPVAKNCRTCASSVATEDGEWQCITFEKYINKQTQLVGCKEHDLKMEFKD